MSNYIRFFSLIVATTAAFTVFMPLAYAEDKKPGHTKTTETPKRQDYKSPPSPELLEQQKNIRTQTRGNSDASPAASQASSSRQSRSSEMPSEKRKPREMAF